MKIILLKNIDKLGKQGEIKNVADGYGLNFLIPKKLAVVASDEKIRQMEIQRQRVKSEKQKIKSNLEQIINKLQDKKITIQKQASDKGKLFGSVSLDEILTGIKKDLGVELDKNQIKFSQHIKEIGEHKISMMINGKKVPLIVKVES